MTIAIQRLSHAEHLPIPCYATDLSAGIDLSAAISDPLTLHPLERVLVPTGFCYALPENLEGQIRPRSGLALKHGITVLNTPGTIDADYRGEVKVLLINLGSSTFVIEPGMRIAQMIIAPVARSLLKEYKELPKSTRNENGFGSTGLF